MKYESLKSLFYQDYNNFDNNYKNRLNNPVAVKTNLFIHPFDKKRQKRLLEKYEIFYLPNSEISILLQDIFTNTKKIENIRARLPRVAEQQLFMTNLVNELQSTNEIEGVRSTKKEINAVMSRILKKDYANQRFEGLVKQYLNLQNEEEVSIKNPSDFRKIWDSLLSNAEVDAQPDGKFFRKDFVYITDGNRNVHEGDKNEEQIISDLDSLISELHDNTIPAIPRYLIAHYFYEYIHPFYDGNGRTGRYILCSYLASILDPLTAITFSSTIAKKKSTYYKAFTEMSDPHNRGEATILIIKLLEVLKKGQLDLLDTMKHDQELLNKSFEFIKNLELSDNAKNILFIYFQQTIFGTDLEKINDNDLAKQLDLSRYMMTQALDELSEKDLIREVSKKPKTHILSAKIENEL